MITASSFSTASPPSPSPSPSSMMATSYGSKIGGDVAATSYNCVEEGTRRSDDDATRRMRNKTWIIQWR